MMRFKISNLSFFCVLIAVLAISCNSEPKGIYFSANGNDAADGSKNAPFKTLAKLKNLTIKPGESIYLHGNDTFAISSKISLKGSKEQKIRITSYGQGVAVINGAKGDGLVIENSENVSISNLKIVGDGRKTNNGNGLNVIKSSFISIDKLDVSGFLNSGIYINSCDSVSIRQSRAHENGFAGIFCESNMKRIYIGYCLTENNPGHPKILDNHSGNGIIVGQVKNGLIEYCESRFNGWDMPRKGNGPVGIWTWDSDSVIIQYCISHHNKSTDKDGGGFDFDGGVTNSILQYNYSHHNGGCGYLLCQYQNSPGIFAGNHVRYNVSFDDGLLSHRAGIYVYTGGDGFENSYVYNNTIVNFKDNAVGFEIEKWYSKNPPKVYFYNNIFISGEDQIKGPYQGSEFKGNLYWSFGDGGFKVDGITDFEKWAKENNQEQVNGFIVGQYADPLMSNIYNELITSPLDRNKIVSFFLTKGSPAIDKGLNLSDFGIKSPSLDFLGNSIQGKLDVGAFEYLK
jgi:hypothetical protein